MKPSETEEQKPVEDTHEMGMCLPAGGQPKNSAYEALRCLVPYKMTASRDGKCWVGWTIGVDQSSKLLTGAGELSPPAPTTCHLLADQQEEMPKQDGECITVGMALLPSWSRSDIMAPGEALAYYTHKH